MAKDGIELSKITETFGVNQGDKALITQDGEARLIDLSLFNADIPIGSEKQVLGYDNGELKPITLGIKQFSDIGGIPSFSNGVLTATGIQPDGSALIAFLEFSTTTPKSGTFPTYNVGGVLKTSDGVANNDAVSMKQYNELLARVEALENK